MITSYKNQVCVRESVEMGRTYEIRFYTNPEGEVYGISVSLATSGNWNWTKNVGSYDDWQIKTRVEDAAIEAGLTIPAYLWYVEPECESFWLVVINENMNDFNARVVNDTEYIPFTNERIYTACRELDTALEQLEEAKSYLAERFGR